MPLLVTIDSHFARASSEWRSIVIQVPHDDTAFRRRRLLAQVLRAELKLPAVRVRHLHRRHAGHRVYVLVYRGRGARADHDRYRRWEAIAEELGSLDNAALAHRLARSTPKKGLP